MGITRCYKTTVCIAACVADADIIYSSCGFFFLLSSFSFSSPNLSGRKVDVYRTSTRGVALVRI